MVKNTKGGSKHKARASKYLNTSSSSIRTSESSDEIYGIITHIYGGGRFLAKCIDGVDRMVHASKKFRTENALRSKYCYCLIGLRSWQSNIIDKIEKCDLLYVYSPDEKEKLLKINGLNWKILSDIEYLDNPLTEEGDFMFSMNDHVNFNTKVDTTKVNETNTKNEESQEQEEEINFDEI